jgi:hypothetical protein
VVAIQFRDKNESYYQLALVEPPDKQHKRRTFDLKRSGKALSKQPVLISDYEREVWEYGKTYILSLRLSHNRIDGIVKDRSGRVLKQTVYELPDAGTGYTPVIRVRQMATKIHAR